MEDVNYLLHRRQMSLLSAAAAASPESRAAHADLARRYGEQVRERRVRNQSAQGAMSDPA